MKKESDIDELFKEQLYEYESAPLKDSWEELSSKLDNLEKEKTVGIFSRKKFVFAAAAVLLLLIGITVVFMNSVNNSTEIAIVEKTVKPSTDEVTSSSEKHLQVKITDGGNEAKSGSPEVSMPPLSEEKSQLISHKTSDTPKDFVLPDSSIISVNKDSKISFHEDFTENRVVYLDGEAFFEVKHKHGLPFIVYGNHSKTKVIGTSFLIRSNKNAHADEIFVKTGKVNFSSADDNGKNVFLKAGMKAITDSPGNIRSEINKDLNYDSWKTKKLVFSGAEMKEVLKAIEQQYEVKVKAEDQEVINCKYTGIFEGTNIDNVIKVLSISFNIISESETKAYVITGKKTK